LRFKCS